MPILSVSMSTGAPSTATSFSPRGSRCAGGDKIVELLFGLFLTNSVALLQHACQGEPVAFGPREIVIGKLAPFLSHNTLHLLPVTLHLIPIHKKLLSCTREQLRGHSWPQIRGAFRPAIESLSMLKVALLLSLVFLTCLAAADPHHTTKADIDRLMTELSNWGRWGKADEVGTVNLITPAKRIEAAALVKDGMALSLSHDALTEKAADNPEPFGHKMTYTGRASERRLVHGRVHGPLPRPGPHPHGLALRTRHGKGRCTTAFRNWT